MKLDARETLTSDGSKARMKVYRASERELD